MSIKIRRMLVTLRGQRRLPSRQDQRDTAHALVLLLRRGPGRARKDTGSVEASHATLPGRRPEASLTAPLGKRLEVSPAAHSGKRLTETRSPWDRRRPAATSTSAACSTTGEVKTPAPASSGVGNVIVGLSQSPGMTLPRMVRDAWLSFPSYVR